MVGFRLLLGLCVAVLVRADLLMFDYDLYNSGNLGAAPSNFQQSSGTKTPMLQVNTWNKELMSKSGSHIFLRHDGKTGAYLDSSPLILSSEDLSAVYVNRSFNAVFDVRVQKNKGEDVLTFFGGLMTEIGLGNGYAHVYDNTYREIYTVRAMGMIVKADLHEFQLNGDGTAIITAYPVLLSQNLTQWGGVPWGAITDSVFQEVDLETNQVLFSWAASEHIDYSLSYSPVSHPWDYFHINSIQKTKTGDYLISSRHTCAIYMISGKTGEVMWQLGGMANDFLELPPAAGYEYSNPVLTMAWQHHARFYMGNESEITLFDNHVLYENGVHCKVNCSRGLHFAIDTESSPKTVRLLREYVHPIGMLSQSQGSMQVLEDGNVFIGWGRNPSFTEHSIDGETVLDVQFSPWRSPATNDDGLDNYRAYKMDWKATPYWDPEIAVDNHENVISVYVSWNGATEVRHWALLSSDSAVDFNSNQRFIAHVPRAGLETRIDLGFTEALYMRALALDVNSKVIGATKIIDVETGDLIETNETSADIGKLALIGATSITLEAEDDGKWYRHEGFFVFLGLAFTCCCLAAACVHASRSGKLSYTRLGMADEPAGTRYQSRWLRPVRPLLLGLEVFGAWCWLKVDAVMGLSPRSEKGEGEEIADLTTAEV